MRLGGAAAAGTGHGDGKLRDRRLFNEMLFSHYKGMTEDRTGCAQ